MEIPVPDPANKARSADELLAREQQPMAALGNEKMDPPAGPGAADVGVWDWDLIRNCVIYSATARAICGFAPGNAPIGYEDVRRVTHPDDLPRIAALVRRALDPAVRGRASYEYRVVRGDGTIRWVLVQGEPMFDTVDGVERAVRYIGTLQDITEHRSLRQAFEASQTRLRLAVEGGRLAVWQIDVRTDCFARSPELNRLLGFPEDADPSIQEIRARYAPGELERVRAAAAEQIDRGNRFLEVEFRYLWPDGQVRWLLLRAELHGEGRQLHSVVGVLIDITERHRVEDKLRSSEARLRLAQRAANTAIWEWDTRTGEVDWSPEVYELLGLDPVADAADTRRAWLEVLHPEDREYADETGPRALREGKDFSFDFRVIRRDNGEERWIRSHGTRVVDDDGTVIRVIGVNLDVTDVHRSQQALERRNRELQETAEQSRRERERMFELSQDLFAVVGFDGYLKAVNPAWHKMLGHDEDTLLSQPLIDLVPAEERAACAALAGAMQRGEHAQRFERRMRCADGSWRWLAWTAVCDGERVYAVGRDVTQQREAATALEEANSQLRRQMEERERMERTLGQVQRLEAVGQLTAGVAHDFNNLLTVILGNIEPLEHASADPKLQRRLGFMRQAALRGATLTSQLLAFSRRQRLQPKPVDLNETVEGMSELLKSTMGGAVQLTTVLKPGLWSALVDPTQIELVILNLAINARDAMPVGGSLTIEAANAVLTAAPQRPGEPQPGDYVAISVTDTGAGMTEEVRARAFEPFFTTKEIGKGSGLGLPQVLGFAEQSGGGVRIESVPGQGTTVVVYLPRVEQGATIEQRSLFADTSAPLSQTRLALLVDDDADVREVTAAKLGAMGFQVIDAGSGAQALELLERHPAVTLLVADFAMPGMNGAEVAQRARVQRPHLPVVFVTGYADQSALAEISGASVVQKPFRDDELERKVSALLVRLGGIKQAMPVGEDGGHRRHDDSSH